jgi:hypothetical protein
VADKYIPQVDYTSRDYTSIREDIISLIPEFSPSWTNRDPADFGMTILEAFAYMGDLLNYYIDRAANEAFISTASQRENVLQIAKLLGYIPTSSTPATVTLTFQNSTANPITVPALTKVATSAVASSTSNQIIFETDAAVTVPAKTGITNGSATVTATQGTTVADELIGISDGQVNQSFKLNESSVINASVSVIISDITYSNVQYLIDYQSYDPVFSTYTDGNNETYINFGDSISGRIPPNNAEIYATYRVGGGADGNVAANTIKYILTNVTSGLTVSNQYISATVTGAAAGGSDPEATDSIRINAPLSVRALNRAVSLSDYSSLVIQVSGVAKATAVADVYTSVTVYFAPYGDKGVEIDGVTPSAIFNNLKSDVSDYLVDKIPANTSVTLQPPTYVDVNVSVSITVLPQYRQTLVKSAVTAIINELLLFDNVSFGDRISLQDLMYAISSVPGVGYTSVSKLVRNDVDLTYTITNKALTANVATLTTSVTHALNIGDSVSITGVDTTFNGTFIVTTITSNTFSYALIAATVGSTASSGSVNKLLVNDIVCDINEIPQSKTISVVATGGVSS